MLSKKDNANYVTNATAFFVSLYTKKFPKLKIICKRSGGKIISCFAVMQLFAHYICNIIMMVVYEDKLSMEVTKDFRQLVNITIAAGKFIVDHPQYELIRVAMKLHLLENEALEDFEIGRASCRE